MQSLLWKHHHFDCLHLHYLNQRTTDRALSILVVVTNDEGLVDNEVIGSSIGMTRELETTVTDPDLSYSCEKAMWFSHCIG